MVQLHLLTAFMLLGLPDAVVLQNSVTVELDSVYTETTRLVIVPLTGRGVSRYTVMTVPYRAGWEEIELIEARTGLWRSGRRGSPATVTERPHRALGSQVRLESSMREMVLTMPGLETGDTVVVHTRRTIRRLPLADCYSYHYSPCSRDSLASGEFTVVNRTAARLLTEWSPCFGPPVTEGEAIRWRIGPQSPLDPHPLALVERPYAAVANGDPARVSRELFRVLDSFPPLDPGLAAEVISAAGGSPEELRRWVAGNVSYMGADIGDWPGFTPKAPGETLHDRAGVCRDTSVLLLHLIRCTGREAWLAMLHTGGGTPGLVGSRSFDHMVVAVPSGEGYQVLDPSVAGVTAGHSYGLRGARYLPLTPSGSQLETIPAEGYRDSISLHLSGRLDQGAVSGLLTATASGAPGELLTTILERVPLAHRNLMMGRFFGAARVDSVTVRNDTVLVAGAWSAPVEQGCLLLPGLRDISLSGTRAAFLLLPRLPGRIRLDAPACEILDITLILGNCRASVPAPVGRGGYSCSLSVRGDTLSMVEKAAVAPMYPDPETIRETLLWRSGSAPRTVRLR